MQQGSTCSGQMMTLQCLIPLHHYLHTILAVVQYFYPTYNHYMNLRPADCWIVQETTFTWVCPIIPSSWSDSKVTVRVRTGSSAFLGEMLKVVVASPPAGTELRTYRDEGRGTCVHVWDCLTMHNGICIMNCVCVCVCCVVYIQYVCACQCVHV